MNFNLRNYLGVLFLFEGTLFILRVLFYFGVLFLVQYGKIYFRVLMEEQVPSKELFVYLK